MIDQSHIVHLQECILGCIITDERTIDSQGISSELFTRGHLSVFQALESILERSAPIDALTLVDELGKEKLGKVGGLEFIQRIFDCQGILARVDQYVNELRRLRELEHRSSLIQALALKEDLTRSDIADALNEVDANEHGEGSATKISEVIEPALLRLVEPGENKGIKTGIRQVDEIFGGVSNLFTIVAAYPGMGKSSLLGSWAVNFAMAGKRVLFYSAEDDKETITERSIVRLAESRATDHLVNAATKVSNLNIWIDEAAGLSGDALATRCRSYVRKHGVDIILIDHLGKIREKGNSPYERASNASAKIADMQKQLAVPVIAASQLRRQKGNAYDLPGIDDIRDSGNIEADARNIILLHRPHYFWEIGKIEEEPDKNEVWIIVGKNNHGRTGRIKSYCDMSRYFIGDAPSGFVPEQKSGGFYSDY